MDTLKWIEFTLTAAVGLGTGAVFFKGSLGNNTIKLLRENKQAQDDAMGILRSELAQHERAAQIRDEKLANLNGQVQTLKDIPLTQIAKSLEVVSKTHLEVQKFLEEQNLRSQQLAEGIAEKIINFMREQGNGKSN